MPDAIADTSPLQYLHQIGKLDLLPRLVQRVLIPHAVVVELAEGRARELNLPDPATLKWVEFRSPASHPKLPFEAELGPGETEVLALGLEERTTGLRAGRQRHSG